METVMPIHNSYIAKIFNQVADLLSIEGANPFRIRAYRKAARIIKRLSKRIEDIIESENSLTELNGIGEDLASKIKQITETGSLELLEKLKKRTDPELLELLDLKGLGPKRVHKLHTELNITNINDLEEALKQKKIRKVAGFGSKIEKKIMHSIQERSSLDNRWLLADVKDICESYIKYLVESENFDSVNVAGSFRRCKETVGDLDLIAISNNKDKAIKHFIAYENVKRILSRGKTKSSVILRSNLQVDLHLTDENNLGSALIYFTGSKSHNIELRKIANSKNLKINEYGVFKKDDKKVTGKTEQDIYSSLNLTFIEPELRENRGEIKAANNGKLPELVALDSIKGDLQTHTEYSDGSNSISDMVKAAKELSYEYLAITDHSKNVRIANGIDVDQLKKQIDEIDELNEKTRKIKILKSCEVDILEDGTLDLPDDILNKLDIVICAIHTKFNLSPQKQTQRIIKAMENQYFNIFAHPTGRKIGKREPYVFDLEKVMKVATKNKCYLEINANPVRLDLDDTNAKMAHELGLKLSISTDAHSTEELKYMDYGIGQARRGWLEKNDIINSRSWSELKELIKK